MNVIQGTTRVVIAVCGDVLLVRKSSVMENVQKFLVMKIASLYKRMKKETDLIVFHIEAVCQEMIVIWLVNIMMQL